MRERVEELRTGRGHGHSSRSRTRRLGRIAVKNPVFVDLLCHTAVVEVWRRFLGPDVFWSTWTANILYLGHGSTHWNAERGLPLYWALEPSWPTSRLTGCGTAKYA